MKETIFYDERCPLCNRVVRWVMQNDREDRFQFAPLSIAKEEFPGLSEQMDLENKSTVYLLTGDGSLLSRSDVVLYVSRRLGGLWKAGLLLKLLPKSWRDAGYRLVAKFRFKFTSRNLSCDLPPVEKRHKFLQFDQTSTSQTQGSA